MITDECCIAKLRKSTSEPFCGLRIAVKTIENGGGIAFCIETFLPFQQIFLSFRVFCFVSRFLYLVCPLAIYSSDIRRLKKTLLLALSNCLMIASSNSVNKVLYVVQDADQNGCWNIRLSIDFLTVIGIG